VFRVRYGLGFYIPEDCILHSHRCENLKSYVGSKVFLSSFDTVGAMHFIKHMK
jgi:hypothetical protein